jgi:hypothetical protein
MHHTAEKRGIWDIGRGSSSSRCERQEQQSARDDDNITPLQLPSICKAMACAPSPSKGLSVLDLKLDWLSS